MRPDVEPAAGSSQTSDVAIGDIVEIGPFEFRWPANDEKFDRGWEFVAIAQGTRFKVKDGVGGRHVYGQHRVHTVTWLNGSPMVEGVAADDYDTSRSLLSLLRIDGRSHVTDEADIPIGYATSLIVRHKNEIDAKYSPRGLAIKLRVDDLSGWAHHAILRSWSKATVELTRGG